MKESDSYCPVCSTRYGDKRYPFENALLRRIAALALLSVVLVLAFVQLLVMEIERQENNILLNMEETAFAITQTAMSFTPTPTRDFADRIACCIELTSSIRVETANSGLPALPSGHLLLAQPSGNRYSMQVSHDGDTARLSPAGSFLNAVFQARISPDGSLIAYVDEVDEGRELVIYNIAERTTVVTSLRAQDSNLIGANRVVWSPDSRQLALSVTRFDGRQNLYIVDVDEIRNGSFTIGTNGSQPAVVAQISAIDWSSKGWLTYISLDVSENSFMLNFYSPSERQAVGSAKVPDFYDATRMLSREEYRDLNNIRVSPDGSRLVFRATDADNITRFGVIELTDPFRLMPLEIPNARGGAFETLAWLSDFRFMYLTNAPTQNVRVLDLEDGLIYSIDLAPEPVQFLDFVRGP